jgi:O-antigen/teichoic acid export membrane protein
MKRNSTSAIPDENAEQPNLSYQTLSGLFWVFSAKGVLIILRAGIIIILARLLTPADFGIVAAALTIVGFSEIFALLGVGPAVVQRPQLEERHIRTGFTFSVLFGIVLAALLWFLAPGIASFYQSDNLTPVLQTIILVFPLSGLTVMAESLMQRELQFRKLARIEVSVYAIGSGIVGVSLAFAGLGAWALVASYLVQQILRAIAVLAAQPHSKKPQLEVKAFKELFYFGGGFTVARVFHYFGMQGDNLVVGRWLGMDALGLYGRAYQLMTIPVNLFGGVLETVLFPTMSKVQNESERLVTAYRRGVALTGLILLPISVVSYLLAPELIDVLLGSAWSEVVTPFRILVIGMLFRTSIKINSTLARAKGAVYRNAWRQGIYAILVVGGAWIGQHWGIPGVALGVLFALAIQSLLMTQLGLSMIPFTWRQSWSIYFPAIWSAAIIGIEVWGVATILRTFNLASILILIACAAVVLITILPLALFAPTYFVGVDGISTLRVLLKRLPRHWFFLTWLRKEIRQYP